MLQAPISDRKTKAEASSKTAEHLPEYEQSSQLMRGIGRSRQSHPLQQRENLAALQKAYGNQAVLRMKGRSPAANPLQKGVLQRKCACGNSAGSSGSCAECQSKQEGILQTKLQIGEPGDRYEQEADRVAEQVMTISDPTVPHVQQGTVAEEREAIQTKLKKSVGFVQSKPALTSKGSLEADQNLENRLSHSGGGSPLPNDVRTFMEPRFGADFSGVRVHTGSDAVQMNQDLNAQAFTYKQDVYFGAQKAPGKDALTAHELAHVVQQLGSDEIRLDQSDDKSGLSSTLSSAPSLSEFSVDHFVNGNFANFDAQYDVVGPLPATGTLFISHGVHMNYPRNMKKDEQTTFENDFVKSVHDKWSNKHLLTLNEPGFSRYQCNVDVTSHIEKNPDDAHTVINVVKPKPSEKQFRSRVSGFDQKKDSKTIHTAKLHFRDPTIEKGSDPKAPRKITEADFIRDVGNFDFDSDKINSDCQEDIDKITDFVKQNASQKDPDVCTFSLEYSGRASSQGDKSYNKKLSERRIQSVDKILGYLPGVCLTIPTAAGEEEATEDAEFQRVSIGVFLENSQKPKSTTQNTAAHEFGHMIGLGDEYVETVPEIPGSRAKFFGDKPTHYDLVKLIIDDTAANELIIQNPTTSIMSGGNDVKRGHYVIFVGAIDIMTRPEIQQATGKPDAKWNVI